MTVSAFDAGIRKPYSGPPPLPDVPPSPAVAVPEIETAPSNYQRAGNFEPEPADAGDLFTLTAERSAAQETVQTWNARRAAVASEIEIQAGRLEGIEAELLAKRRAIVRGELRPSATAPALQEKSEAEAQLVELRAQLDVVTAEQDAAQRAYQATAQRAGAAELRAQADALRAEAAESDALLSSLMEPLVSAANARVEIESRGRELARRIGQHDADPAQPAKAGAFDASCTYLRWGRIPAANLRRAYRWPGES
jgi:predicted nucleic acid-binding protein